MPKIMFSLSQKAARMLREEKRKVYYDRVGSQSIIVERALRLYLRTPGHERLDLAKPNLRPRRNREGAGKARVSP